MRNKYAVFGNPIKHSKSPLIHQLFAVQTQQILTYDKILVPLADFPQQLAAFIADGGSGANVTVPFKAQAFDCANIHTPEAQCAQAVNTLHFREGKIIGHNTDGLGLINDLTQRHQIPLAHKTILVLGAGGASRGILAPLLAAKPAKLYLANRNHEKALALAMQFASLGEIEVIAWSQATMPVDLLINATSASLTGNFPALPDALFQHLEVAYDLMYQQDLTLFLRYCQMKKVPRLLDGLGMLVEQAALSFAFWRGVIPLTQPVYQQLRREIEAN